MDICNHLLNMTCDLCKSTNIIETREEYVCCNCGGVLELPKLVYNHPYQDSQIQNATLGTTQIGNARERFQNGNSVYLRRLNKIHSNKTHKEITLIDANVIMNSIFEHLHLADKMKPLVMEKFKKIHTGLQPGTKYRSPDKLIPLTIYFVFKMNSLPISEGDLLNVSNISKEEFNAFKLQILNFIPQYRQRDRQEYVNHRILEISEHFQLGMSFYYHTKNILTRLWDILKNTKDDVIAGVVSSISLLCNKVSEVSIHSICCLLGIRMSTIQSQIKKKIFDRFRIPGFVSLVKSSDLLKTIMQKLDLVNNEEEGINQAKKSLVGSKSTSRINRRCHFGIKLGVKRTVHFFHDFFKLKIPHIYGEEGKLVLKMEKLRVIMVRNGKGPPNLRYRS